MTTKQSLERAVTREWLRAAGAGKKYALPRRPGPGGRLRNLSVTWRQRVTALKVLQATR